MSDSDDGSAPPPPAGTAVPASSHPVWQNSRTGGSSASSAASSRGRGRGRAGKASQEKGKNKPPPPPPPPGKFAPISLGALELRLRQEGDGASSCGGDDESRAIKRTKSNKSKKRGRGLEYDDDDDGGSAADDDDDEAELARVAFGGAPKECDASIVSDTESATSSVARAAAREFAFGGIRCVGCAAPTKVAVVDDFVRANAASMTETALYKLAALKYKTAVEDPARAEGVAAPPWDWKALQTHYELHRVDPKMQRLSNLRALSSLKKSLELSLMREDPATGAYELDPNNANQLLKVMQLHSREIALLSETPTSATAGRGKK